MINDDEYPRMVKFLQDTGMTKNEALKWTDAEIKKREGE